ncbi:unnamed protein product [Pleuronectes platessa]|uniref:Uncharacterized protein n=1 Tax=Pleuronectes platessa TaxID=8262 RepID=A0A9N7YAF0_PLEPL|nr:unnamed protein product [Pleuronectes platessa]
MLQAVIRTVADRTSKSIGWSLSAKNPDPSSCRLMSSATALHHPPPPHPDRHLRPHPAGPNYLTRYPSPEQHQNRAVRQKQQLEKETGLKIVEAGVSDERVSESHLTAKLETSARHQAEGRLLLAAIYTHSMAGTSGECRAGEARQ